MIPSPAKCRSRIRALRAWISACPPDKPGEKGSSRKLLLCGVVPAGFDLPGWMAGNVDAEDTGALSMTEMMTLDTWFYQYPEKVCGKETLTTSQEFPLTITGTRRDCEVVFEKFLGSLKPFPPITARPNGDSEAEALATLALMEMLELEMT